MSSDSKDIDAVVIATPVHTHFALAKGRLLQGKHVLIEKPMTSSVREADELIDLAAQKGLTLMADHTFSIYRRGSENERNHSNRSHRNTPVF